MAHDELTETMRRVLWRARFEGERVGEVVGEDLYLKAFSDGVINIAGHGRELRRDDVDAVRAALSQIGYVEIESWVATQGMSWLSAGMPAGVSFRVEPAGGVS